MEKTFTNDSLQYVYNELSSENAVLFEQKILGNISMLNQVLTDKRLILKLNQAEVEPSDICLDELYDKIGLTHHDCF